MIDPVCAGRTEVLLVDDERETCEEIAEFLGAYGFVCHVADSVDAALATLAVRQAIGVVLTDLRMPHRSGFDLLRDVARADDHRKVIVMTGHHTRADADSSAIYGAAGFLTKPLDPYAVLDAVRRAMAADAGSSGAES